MNVCYRQITNRLKNVVYMLNVAICIYIFVIILSLNKLDYTIALFVQCEVGYVPCFIDNFTLNLGLIMK